MKNKTLLPVLLTISSCLLYQTPAYSSVYKWIDRSGQTHYSDQANEANATELKIHKTNNKPRDKKPTSAKEEITDNDVKKPEPVKKEAPKLSKTEKQKRCREAKNRITNISSRGRMREINPKGEYSYLSEKQRQKRLSAEKNSQRKYCR